MKWGLTIEALFQSNINYLAAARAVSFQLLPTGRTAEIGFLNRGSTLAAEKLVLGISRGQPSGQFRKEGVSAIQKGSWPH